MELAHSLLLNEQALSQIPEHKRPVFIFEWLRYLDGILPVTQRADIKGCQQKLVEQLLSQIQVGPGPPVRKLLGHCMATLFTVGDTFSLFQAINTCNDILKSRDDSPSQLPSRLAAIRCLGAMYEKLGRMVGRSYEETAQLLVKALKNAESQGRTEIIMTMEKMTYGLGSAGASVHKDIYKAAKALLNDRATSVRSAAAGCLKALVKEAPFIIGTELESLSTVAFKALEGSNHEVRCAISKMLGELVATAHNPSLLSCNVGRPAQAQTVGPASVGIEDCLGVLATGFLRGTGGFLKSTPGAAGSVAKEIRVGVSLAYVEFAGCLGSVALDRSLGAFVRGVVDLASNFKTVSTISGNGAHLECVYARRCIGYILRATLGKLLGEKAQSAACKELGQLIAEQINQTDLIQEPGIERTVTPELAASQNVLVCALLEISCLVQQLSTAATPLFTEASGIMEPIFACLLHPLTSTRLAAAWCLRCITVAVPSLVAPLIDRCLSRLEHLRSSADAISGYSYALTALLGGAHLCELGIPYTKGKQVLQFAEELLRTAAQSSRLSMMKTQAGWLLLAAVMRLGPSTAKHHLSRMLFLWRNAFPRSTKEAETEKTRGDSFTWQVTLESRCGALCSIQSFFSSCSELATDEVVRRILVPIDSCLTMLSQVNDIVKQHGNQLKTPLAVLKLRLFQTLAKLAPRHFENSFATLLRELVAELTLTDNTNAVTTSLLQQICHHDDTIILGSWLQDTDCRAIEDQIEPNRRADQLFLQPVNYSGAGCLDHDPYVLCVQNTNDIEPPWALPLSVATLDAAVCLYGKMFPRVAAKHRVQMLDHFVECIRQAKGPRQQAVQLNILGALLAALKAISEQKGNFDSDAVRKSTINLILGGLSAQNPIIRCAAAESLGRTAQVVGDAKFVAEMAQFSFDKLKVCRDLVNRTGFSLALACLHRYVGGLGSGQHLNTSVSILLALAQDTTAPVVQVWAVHALALIAESGGPMFRGYVDPTLGLCLKQQLSTPYTQADLHQAVGKLISALITTVGPELQGNVGGIVTTRSNFFAACGMMSENPDPLVQAEAVACLQQLHMFAPRHVNMSILVPQLCRMLNSRHLILRRAATGCLRQLAQREAREVYDHAQTLVPSGLSARNPAAADMLPDTGLEGALFSLLDNETDWQLVNNIKETLLFLAQCLVAENLSHWLSLCKDILSSTTSDLLSPQDDKLASAGNSGKGRSSAAVASVSDEQEDDTLHAGAFEPEPGQQKVPPRWRTRQFALEVVRKIIGICEAERAHFDPVLAKELQIGDTKADFLVFHLSELVRMAFMASTSDCNDLRMAGLAALQDIINKFAKVPEPEFPGHVILEQFQAQVGAALRPAFAPEVPSNVTAAACDVCSTWIGSGVARDLNDLRRVHQLLVSSLSKLKKGSISTQLYNESASTLEKLAILKAWAEVYIVAMKQESERRIAAENQHQKLAKAAAIGQDVDDDYDMEAMGSDSLLKLVTPELSSLVGHWMAALKDYGLLSLPAEFSSQLPAEGGAFYTPETMDSVRPHYRQAWAPILLAATTWLTVNEFELPKTEVNSWVSESQTAASVASKNAVGQTRPDTKVDRFNLIVGISMEVLCSPRSLELLETIHLCLETLRTALDDSWSQLQLMSNAQIAVEILNVMHRLILTRESHHTQLLCLDVVEKIIAAAEFSKMHVLDHSYTADDSGSKEFTGSSQYCGNEGEEQGKLKAGNSVVFATLEVCLCALVRQIPQVNPAVAKSKSGIFAHKKPNRLTAESHVVLKRAMEIMIRLPDLCSQMGVLSILPSILFLIIGVIKETSRTEQNPISVLVSSGAASPASAAALKALHFLCSRSLLLEPANDSSAAASTSTDRKINPIWLQIMQAAVATVLGLHRNSNDEASVVDPVVVLLSLAIFFVVTPLEVTCSTGLMKASIEVFAEMLQSKSLVVQHSCVQTLHSIFGHKDPAIAVPFIVNLAGPVLHKIEQPLKRGKPDIDTEHRDSVEASSKHASLFDEVTEENLPVIKEALKCLETFIGAAPIEKRQSIMGLFISTCVGYVDLHRECQEAQMTTSLTSSASSAAAAASRKASLTSSLNQSFSKTGPLKALRDHVLQRLTKVGTTFPCEFKQSLSAAPQLRNRLEAALRANAQPSTAGGAASESAKPAALPAPHQPSIKLKTEFSAFAAVKN